MKNLKIIIANLLTAAILLVSCQEDDFTEYYSDPATIAETTVEKQYAGFMQSNKDDIMPSYSKYFVTGRPTLMIYTQTRGFENSIGRFTPGDAPVDPIYNRYYATLFQFREMERIYDQLTPAEQDEYRIFIITAKIYLYDYTQKIVDLFGDIPFTEAGKISQNEGDYQSSYAAFDSAESIYRLMIDDLKSIAQELNSISLTTAIKDYFTVQDFVNGGDIDIWKKYCNSLRIRLLTRASASDEFSSIAQTQIGEILGNPATYPIVEGNEENIQIESLGEGMGLQADFQGTFVEGDSWNSNVASKAMIDHMVENTDPRLRCIFQPGSEAGENEFLGLDPTMAQSAQNALINSGTVSIYNNWTFKNNRNFPGILISASDIDFYLSEYYLGSNDAMAKEHYEKGISESINFYYSVRDLAINFEDSPEIDDLDPSEIDNYLMEANISWDAATSNEEKLALLARQKWLHTNMVEMYENWAELRRLGLPELEFVPDNSSAQATPPNRFLYPSVERTFNAENYSAVSEDDNLDAKIFWDID
ncbi:SusD/RagB family nutrient-binding outer membrane lipoprotein [Pseudozobellia thermophila]|uniref:Starch-binding associating with outer membrane n=1 Tax=Pseudozobellia thermophila TaxID=192903 RepID=A0A1M6MXH6_9FLAO|nr:SusD/RagB family nutrient-binding outer membrane lipoprotein [Pseudozobellia thermophila]SHJ88177.1 Starch-binding associating with outer membrane [Pseudozobellia thermophila]